MLGALPLWSIDEGELGLDLVLCALTSRYVVGVHDDLVDVAADLDLLVPLLHILLLPVLESQLDVPIEELGLQGVDDLKSRGGQPKAWQDLH